MYKKQDRWTIAILIMVGLIFFGYVFLDFFIAGIREYTTKDLRVEFYNNKEIFMLMSEAMLQKDEPTAINMDKFKPSPSFDDTDALFINLYYNSHVDRVYKYNSRICFTDYKQEVFYSIEPEQKIRDKYAYYEKLDENWYYTDLHRGGTTLQPLDRGEPYSVYPDPEE